MTTLEVNSIRQEQSLTEIALLRTIPKNVVDEIVEIVATSDDPLNEIRSLIKTVGVIQRKSDVNDYQSIQITWKRETISQSKRKVNFPSGFKLNSIERVLAYVTLLVMLGKIVTYQPETPITINNYIFQQYEEEESVIREKFKNNEVIEI